MAPAYITVMSNNTTNPRQALKPPPMPHSIMKLVVLDNKRLQTSTTTTSAAAVSCNLRSTMEHDMSVE
eukprot:scaffold4087_cov153-Skeletonema_marinoi.AAC.1